MKTYAGIDLHSSNNYLGIIDDQDKRLLGRRLPNNKETIIETLKPFKKTLKGIAIDFSKSIALNLMGDWSGSNTVSYADEVSGACRKVNAQKEPSKKLFHFCCKGLFFLLTSPLMGDPFYKNIDDSTPHPFGAGILNYF